MNRMKTTQQVRRAARKLFRLCIVNGFLDDVRVRQVVQGLLHSKRRSGHAVLSQLVRLVKFDRSRHTAEVDSAMSLPPDVQASVLAGLERVYGPGIGTSFSLNPALIGGMRIRVGSDVYDGTVRAGLAALQTRF